MLVVSERVNLSGYTTLRLGGPAKRLVSASTEDEIIAAVQEADLAGEPLLVLGGGSNLVVADAGFAGTVVRLATAGVTVADAGIYPVGGGVGADDGIRVVVQAGENWDRLVEWAVSEKLSGVECLAGIPGLVGATPIQNVGAYGQEVARVIEVVRAYDRVGQAIVTLTAAECGFGYRTSLFKRTQAWTEPRTEARTEPEDVSSPEMSRGTNHGSGADVGSGSGTGSGTDIGSGTAAPTGRYVVLGVTFRLERSPMSAPVRYPELAATLGIAPGEHAPLVDVRAAVLGLRRSKGMVLDPADPDTVNAGSFFTNPLLDRDQFARLERAVEAKLGPGAGFPHFPADHGQIKVAAGWLIEQAGFAKGYPAGGAARISAKHTLALTNRGQASTSDLIDLAREIVAGVRSEFGIELANEPVLVGVTL
jgi:UDP-N-acetylmuramate dehydrogenase